MLSWICLSILCKYNCKTWKLCLFGVSMVKLCYVVILDSANLLCGNFTVSNWQTIWWNTKAQLVTLSVCVSLLMCACVCIWYASLQYSQLSMNTLWVHCANVYVDVCRHVWETKTRNVWASMYKCLRTPPFLFALWISTGLLDLKEGE